MASRSGDPRASLSPQGDVRPIVALPRAGLPGWLLLGFAIVAGVLLFSLLDARRRATSAPSVQPRAGDVSLMPTAPPPLYIPPVPAPPALSQMPAQTQPAAPPTAPAASHAAPPAAYFPPPPEPIAPPPQPRIAAEPVLVYDGSAPRTAQGAHPAGAAEASAGAPSAPGAAGPLIGTRTRAGMLANRATTVPQGTLIPAVLETALDSTRPGLARAIVSRDVRGFDGTRILIPRGSRLIGEYDSEVRPGQHRALVNWLRQIRPDGVTIAIGSPGSDPLGRTGTRARVNSHFLARFAGAILQSVLDIGVNVAAARAGNGAVVVLPGAVQNSTGQVVQPRQVTPTLSVRRATSITIFVARDLDFTGADAAR
jgi:type IV secretion system protein VirB10